jgi:hypothetical protein
MHKQRKDIQTLSNQYAVKTNSIFSEEEGMFFRKGSHMEGW